MIKSDKRGNFLNRNFYSNKYGQVTIFVIIAIIIVAGVGAYFVFRGSLSQEEIPVEMQPIYEKFLSCIEEETKTGINLLESQGGYIYTNEIDFESGSKFSPFSSHLNFLGNPIPYWYYISGNNLQRENVPSISDMEKDLEKYLQESIGNCNFDNFHEKGFQIIQDVENFQVNADIKEDKVLIDANLGLQISRGEERILVKNHEVFINSKLGKLYSDAMEIYEYEQDTLFLENYGVDFLRTYAPVDGVEIDCSPKTWNAEEIFDDLEEAIESNTIALRNSEGNYELKNKYSKYFVVDIPVDSEVRFLNSRNWPSSFSVSPSKGPLLIAEPVGNSQGLGILGFCYVPYHFVYDMKYPVLVQVYEYSDLGMEIFQFPLAVVIDGNMPRESLDASAVQGSGEIENFCQYNNSQVQVNVNDESLNPVDSAEIFYECSGTDCYIGKTDSSGELNIGFPDCVNGRIVARAPGYEESEEIFSSVDGGEIELRLNKEYSLDVDLSFSGSEKPGNSIISFNKEDSGSKTIIYPEQTRVNLSEGQYTIEVMSYRDSSLVLEGQTYEQCVEVPREGIGSLMGLTKEECYDVEIPKTEISNALAGGGTQNYYMLESDLEKGKINIRAKKLPIPVNLEQLQENYDSYESQGLGVSFG